MGTQRTQPRFNEPVKTKAAVKCVKYVALDVAIL